jgi:hypothetical protein
LSSIGNENCEIFGRREGGARLGVIQLRVALMTLSCHGIVVGGEGIVVVVSK